MYQCRPLFFLPADPLAANKTLKVYLTGWDSTSAGRGGLVVVEYRGVNGTICDDRFDLADGDVICRMLGFSHALETRGAFNFFDYSRGFFQGPIWIDDLTCNGHETSIIDCSFPGWGINDCSHYEDVSLICASVCIFAHTCVCVCACCLCEHTHVQHQHTTRTLCCKHCHLSLTPSLCFLPMCAQTLLSRTPFGWWMVWALMRAV